MKVSDLQKLLETADPDAVVVLRGQDHSYRNASAEKTTALNMGHGEWCEDHGEKYTPEAEYGPRKPVLLFT